MHIVGGIHKGKSILAPKGDSTRPTSERLRGALFNICRNDIEGARFLDLFAGSGSVGLEALSRGAKKVVFVENNRQAFAVLKKNISNFNIESLATAHCQDALAAIEGFIKSGLQFEIIFADPPYNLTQKGTLLIEEIIDKILDSDILIPGGQLFIEEGTEALKKDHPTASLQSLRRYGSTYLYHFEKSASS